MNKNNWKQEIYKTIQVYKEEKIGLSELRYCIDNQIKFIVQDAFDECLDTSPHEYQPNIPKKIWEEILKDDEIHKGINWKVKQTKQRLKNYLKKL